MKIESLKFEGITFSHEGHGYILKNTDFEFPTGEIILFKADEGSGKSSLLQIMAALQTPQSGKYLINEENIFDMSFEEFLPYRLQIGYSFDYGGLISNKTILDNLTLPLLYHKLTSPKEAKVRVEEMLKRFDIAKFANERPAHVPGRVRKLACLLRAFVTQPQIILMDDPSVGIGQEAAGRFADFIHEMRDQGFATHIFMSSYDDSFNNLFDHRVVYLEDAQMYIQTAAAEKKVVSL